MISIATAPAPGHAASAPAARPIVRVSGLTKRFAERRGWREMVRHPLARPAPVTVVNDVSFEIAQGEFFGLLGANGAGKSTLFRMLSAQLIPDQGTAMVDGCDVVRDPRGIRTRLTPVVTDERSLNWRLTARENLDLFAALYGIEKAEAPLRIEELLETVELADTGNKMVGTFSSGMKQRLLIARALLARPRVLLLDEPTRSLDPISARRLREFLRTEIIGRQGCTVLLATHSAEEAFELCDRVAVLERGRLLAVGKVRELMGEVSDDLYHLEVREAQLPTLTRLHGEACSLKPIGEGSGRGWVRLQMRIPDGADGAADTLGSMARAGIDVSHFQRIDLTLADLIERIVERRGRLNHA